MLPPLNDEELEIFPKVLDYHVWTTYKDTICSVAIKGQVEDWAAYIGSTSVSDTKFQELNSVLLYVKRFGAKLSEKEAVALYPNIKLRYRR